MFWQATAKQSEEATPLNESMICAWASETFPSQPTRAIVEKLKKEVLELSVAFQNGKDITSEVGDIFIVLSQLARAVDTSVYQASALKMLINLERTWEKQPDGTYQHVSEASRH